MLLGVSAPFALIELSNYLLLSLCVWHALRQGALRRARVIELGSGVLYGLMLEWLTILQFHSYQYGHFIIMFGPVPLVIAVGWGVILYSMMALADAVALPVLASPALVALLGLNIDLSMDAVAIRLHMWEWVGIAYNQQWFGVPYNNFYAWFMVLLSFSALLWLVRRFTSRPGWRGLLAGLGALFGSVIILIVLDGVESQYLIHGGIVWLPAALVVAGALIVVARGMLVKRSAIRSPAIVETPVNILVPALVPLCFHLLFLTILLITGIAVQLPLLLVVSLSMLVLSLVFHAFILQSLHKAQMSVLPSDQNLLSEEVQV